MIGPIKSNNGKFEVARLDKKVEDNARPLKEVKNKIKVTLDRTEKDKAFKTFMDSLKEKSPDKIVKSSRMIEAEKAAEEEAKKAAENAPPGMR